jgi:hypothetical protein
MTTWRNKKTEGFTKKKDKIENFSNIPMFDVLLKELNKEQENIKEPFIEGAQGKKPRCAPFDMFCNDYFDVSSKKKQRTSMMTRGITDIKKYINDIIEYIDKTIIEDSIYETIKTGIMHYLDNCELNIKDTNTQPELNKKPSAETSFTWLKPSDETSSWLRNNIVDKFTNREGFSTDDITTTKFIDTINSLNYNHPDLDNDKVGEKYIKDLKQYFLNNGKVLTEKSLFDFNTGFDKLLSDPRVKSQLKPTVAVVTSQKNYSSYPNRYVFTSTDTINAPQIPQITNINNLIDKLKELPTSSNLNEVISSIGNWWPLESVTYSTGNIVTSNSVVVPDFLNQMTVVFFNEYLVIKFNNLGDTHNFKKQIGMQKYSAMIFVLGNIAYAYTEYLNMVSFIKQNKKPGEQLTNDEIKNFNIFFIKIFNNTHNGDTSPLYIQICRDINNKNEDKWWSSTIGIEGEPFSNVSTKEELIGFIETGKINKKRYNPRKDIINYYKIDIISPCITENNELLEECRNIAKTVKSEIYRLFMTPIFILLVYNFYYIFFFKDSFSYAKDGSGKNNETPDDCYYPMFPDWENIFHKFEGHFTDFFLEFIFKPVKILYYILNFVKDSFIAYTPKFLEPIMNWVGGNLYLFNKINLFKDLSYVFFIACIAIIGVLFFVPKYSSPLYILIKNLLQAKTPEPFSFNDFNEIVFNTCAIITWIFFAKSFFIGVSKTYSIPTNVPEMVQKFTSSPLLTVLSLIVYWLFKFLLTTFFIPISVFILIVYILWMGTLSIFNYTDSSHNYMDKIEVINRSLYTPLCDINFKSTTGCFKSIIKFPCFLIIYFLVELVICYNVYTSITVFNNLQPKNGINNNSQKAIRAIKHILFCISFIFLILLLMIFGWSRVSGIWRVYNDFNKEAGPERSRRLDTSYCESIIPTNNTDGIPKDQAEQYNTARNDPITAVITALQNPQNLMSTNDDNSIYDIFSKYYNSKTNHQQPIAKSVSNTLVGYKKQVDDYLNEGNAYVSEKIESPLKSSFFGDITNKISSMATTASNDFNKNSTTQIIKNPIQSMNNSAQFIKNSIKSISDILK